jgi:hypothetical protein
MLCRDLASIHGYDSNARRLKSTFDLRQEILTFARDDLRDRAALAQVRARHASGHEGETGK